MSQENITFDLEIGTVQNPSSFVRLNVQSDQNEKGRIASICGCHPETGSIVVRVSNQATEEVLDPVFQALTESTYAELQSQGKVQEFPEGSHKWIKVPLDIVAGGMLSEQVVPMLSGNENLSGNLQVVIESDADGYSLAPFKAEGRSILYGVFKSFRINASTNFSKDQLQAISELVSGILGIPMEKYSSFFSKPI